MSTAKKLVYVLFLLLGFAVAGNLGLARLFGAHPWWASSVVYLGLAIALVPAAAASLWAPRNPFLLALAALGFVIAVAATFSGKRRFAASFAEDATAGSMWYFGWIGTVACLFFFLALMRREG